MTHEALILERKLSPETYLIGVIDGYRAATGAAPKALHISTDLYLAFWRELAPGRRFLTMEEVEARGGPRKGTWLVLGDVDVEIKHCRRQDLRFEP